MSISNFSSLARLPLAPSSYPAGRALPSKGMTADTNHSFRISGPGSNATPPTRKRNAPSIMAEVKNDANKDDSNKRAKKDNTQAKIEYLISNLGISLSKKSCLSEAKTPVLTTSQFAAESKLAQNSVKEEEQPKTEEAVVPKRQLSQRKKVVQTVEAKVVKHSESKGIRESKLEASSHSLASILDSFSQALPSTSKEIRLPKMEVVKIPQLSKSIKKAKLQIEDYIKQMKDNGVPNSVTVAKINDVLGYGVFATKKISQSHLIGFFAGEYTLRSNQDDTNHPWDYELISLDETQSKKLAKSSKKNQTYRLCIDARIKGNFTRFLNHSAESANVIPLIVKYAGKLQCAFVSSKRIEVGQQLLVNYEETYVWPEEPVKIAPDTFTLVNGRIESKT